MSEETNGPYLIRVVESLDRIASELHKLRELLETQAVGKAVQSGEEVLSPQEIEQQRLHDIRCARVRQVTDRFIALCQASEEEHAVFRFARAFHSLALAKFQRTGEYPLDLTKPLRELAILVSLGPKTDVRIRDIAAREKQSSTKGESK